jgi:hypothetical protein
MKWKTFLSMALLGAGFSLGNHSLVGANTLNLLMDVSGTVERKAPDWSGYQSVSIGDPLGIEDRLRVRGQNAYAVVWCTNDKKWRIGRGTVKISEGCPDNGVRWDPNDTQAPPRTGIDPQQPYILAPRNTAIMPGQEFGFAPRKLMLRWHPTEEAQTYRVVVKTLLSGRWVSEPTSGSSIRYSGELEPSTTYQICLMSDRDSGGICNASSLPTFKVLDVDTAEKVKQEMERLQAQNLPAPIHQLSQANLYARYELHQAAIDTLRPLVDSGSENLAVYKLQAQLYEQIGLPPRAIALYKQALALAAEDNFSDRAYIQERLGRLQYQGTNYAEAVTWLQQARQSYSQFLDLSLDSNQKRLQALEEKLTDARRRSD